MATVISGLPMGPDSMNLFEITGCDPLTNSTVSSGDSMRYCDHMSQCLGLSSTEFDDLYRFFHLSSMAHCCGGNKAGVIGDLADGSVSTELRGNALMTFTQWLEKGFAREMLPKGGGGDCQ